MNEQLIKKHKNTITKNFIIVIISFSVLFYIYSQSIITIILLVFSIAYGLIKKTKILLEIREDENVIYFISYSIFNGIKERNLKLKQIEKIEFDKELIITYRGEYGKVIDTYNLNAEPWNNLYVQIKKLKLQHQECKKINL